MRYASIVQTLTGGSAAPVAEMPAGSGTQWPGEVAKQPLSISSTGEASHEESQLCPRKPDLQPEAIQPPAEPKIVRADPNIATAIEIIDEIVAQTNLIAMNAALDSCDPFSGPADAGDDPAGPDDPDLLPFDEL